MNFVKLINKLIFFFIFYKNYNNFYASFILYIFNKNFKLFYYKKKKKSNFLL